MRDAQLDTVVRHLAQGGSTTQQCKNPESWRGDVGKGINNFDIACEEA